MVKKNTVTRFLRRDFDTRRYLSPRVLHQFEQQRAQVEKIDQLGNNESLLTRASSP